MVGLSAGGSLIQDPVLTYSYKSAEEKEYTQGLPTNAGTYEIKVSVAALLLSQ